MLLSLLLACSSGSEATKTPSAGGAKPDVVVVTLDTTRADRIGAYGYDKARTDFIDALAAKGTRFTQAYSPMPLTIPSHATMFTGLHPYRHGIRSNGDNVLAPSFTTLAEHLQGAGWSTAASVAAFVTTRQWGFNQGFDAYFDSLPEPEAGPDGKPADQNFWHHERPASEVIDDALGWLAAQPADKPVFLWIHVYDAHFPYTPHPDQGEDAAQRPYDAEIGYVDDQLARLQAAFTGREVLWALIGDHGEGLGEHGETAHGMYAYNPTAHIPFILSGYSVPKAVVDEPVSSADLTPTLLKILGLPIPDGLDGKPQPGSPTVPYIESYQLSERFQLAPHVSVVADGYKLINTPKPELYDQKADPGEKSNIADQKPEVVAKLKTLLAEKNALAPGASSSAIDAATVAQLAALGYITGEGADGLDFASLPDPKDFREELARVNRLDFVRQNKGAEAALAEIDAIIPKLPQAFELRMRKFNLLRQLKRTDELRAFAAQLAADFPTKSRVWVTLAAMALQDGDIQQALEHAEKAVQVEPTGLAGQEAVVEALLRLRRSDEAIQRGEEWMKANPQNYGVAALLGQFFLSRSDYQKAEQYLRIAVSGPNPRRAARSQLALLAAGAGARADALKLLEAEVKDFPGNLLARRMLAKLYGEDLRWLDQKEQLEFIRKVKPNDPRVLLAVAQVDFNLKDYLTARKGVNAALAVAPDDPDVLLLHANLLAKEGKRDEGKAVFDRANALNAERVKAAEAEQAKRDKQKGATGTTGTPATTGATGAAGTTGAAGSTGATPAPPPAKP